MKKDAKVRTKELNQKRKELDAQIQEEVAKCGPMDLRDSICGRCGEPSEINPCKACRGEVEKGKSKKKRGKDHGKLTERDLERVKKGEAQAASIKDLQRRLAICVPPLSLEQVNEVLEKLWKGTRIEGPLKRAAHLADLAEDLKILDEGLLDCGLDPETISLVPTPEGKTREALVKKIRFLTESREPRPDP